jgi:predicted 3-demethylubiquinone-9 3-methyltransferase (glyoxalase superfamily)
MTPQRGRTSMQKITPFLWFDSEAEEAANFYVSIFPNSRVVSMQRYGKAGPGPEGSVMLVAFELEGQAFTALNGGPIYKFTPAVSFVIDCKSQGEVDHFWGKLADGGQEQPCAWLNDRYGVA